MPNNPKATKRKVGRPRGQAADAVRGTAKELCLQIGAELFLERAASMSNPVGKMSRRAVAGRAGVSPNTVTKHFPSHEDWTDALAQYLLGRSDLFREEFDYIKRVLDRTKGQDPLTAITEVATADLTTIVDNPAWNAMEILATCVAPRSPAVAETARECYRDLDHTTWNEVYGVIMMRAGRVPRAPFTTEMIGALIQALVEGCGIRQIVDPDTFLSRDRVGAMSRSGGFALAVATLLAILTMPAGNYESAKPERVEDLLEAMLQN